MGNLLEGQVVEQMGEAMIEASSEGTDGTKKTHRIRFEKGWVSQTQPTHTLVGREGLQRASL